MILEADANEKRVERSRNNQPRDVQSQGQGSNNPAKLTKSDNRGQGGSRRRNSRSKTPGRNSQQNASGCAFCGRPNHNETECWKKMGKCLRCGSQDHMVRSFPMMRDQARGQQGSAGTSGSVAAAQPWRDTEKGIVEARVYTLSKDDVPESTTVVGGTIYISGILAHVLIDPGVTHSFIASEFARNLHGITSRLPYVLEVSTPACTCLLSDTVMEDSEIMVAGIELSADLIVLPIRDFDVILGMDWLYAHHACVDCYNKMMTFYLQDGTECKFIGEKNVTAPIISHTRAHKYLKQGCEGYLAYVIDHTKGTPSIEQVPVVCDFPDVFPDELTSLPPERDIEFRLSYCLELLLYPEHRTEWLLPS
ncbi:RVP_2 domain-containing protein [Cephalotus follicularis]|uniref:RVP_2 domain-containing protein n=1 Tax=Cephalotus follicularis TaxID=3775 RepID=A0A1Q3AN38_CEPFO|nr:RVP_2 domain-containing protein [Cephalotus follicularis]